MHAIKRGLLWQQRDRIFSRWKERYFILTKDYLHCFKRSSGLHNISPMGQFIFKIKLVELEKVEWLNKKSYSIIGLALQGRESRIFLRCSTGLEDWFELLEECTIASKERRLALRKLHDPNWDQNEAFRSEWISNTDKQPNDSTSMLEAVLKRRSRCGPEFDLWSRNNHENRLSLMTDIDINSWSSTPPPSAPSTFRGRPYRFNTDVFFLPQGNTNTTTTMSSGRSLLTPVSSFRNGTQFQTQTHHVHQNHHYEIDSKRLSIANENVIRYRERSQSDALSKIRGLNSENKRASYVATNISQL